MKLYIKNKVMSLRGNSFVLDEEGKNVYEVKGKFFSFTNKKRIYDMNGNKLFVVKNKYFKFFNTSCYICDAHGHKLAKVVNGDFDFKNRYKVMNYSEEIELDGMWGNMQIKKNGTEDGSIIKNATFVGDAFTLETEDKELAPFYVALTIAVDNINDRRRKGR